MLGVVLLVMVGEQAQEMQLAHWIPTTDFRRARRIPSWMGLWFAVFPTVETLAAQAIAALLVLGSYVLARPRVSKRGRGTSRRVVAAASSLSSTLTHRAASSAGADRLKLGRRIGLALVVLDRLESPPMSGYPFRAVERVPSTNTLNAQPALRIDVTRTDTRAPERATKTKGCPCMMSPRSKDGAPRLPRV